MAVVHPDKLEEFVKGMGSKGLARAKVGDDGSWSQAPLFKSISPELRAAINEAVGAKPGDLIAFQFGKVAQVQTVMANLRLHLGKRGLDPDGFALPALAAASDGFSGAEIEQAVVAGLYAAHAEQRPLDTELLMGEIRGTRPLSVLMAEQVQALRDWARERTVPAD